VTCPACRSQSPTLATSTMPSYKTRLEDVSLETGSSYSDVCIDRWACLLQLQNWGFVATPSMPAPFRFGDVTDTLSQDPIRRCRLGTGSSYSGFLYPIYKACRSKCKTGGCGHAQHVSTISRRRRRHRCPQPKTRLDDVGLKPEVVKAMSVIDAISFCHPLSTKITA